MTTSYVGDCSVPCVDVMIPDCIIRCGDIDKFKARLKAYLSGAVKVINIMILDCGEMQILNSDSTVNTRVSQDTIKNAIRIVNQSIERDR